jgi:hypothetical protein
MISFENDTIFEKNPDQGRILLFHQNFTEMDHGPRNLFLGSIPARFLGRMYGFFGGEQKCTMNHEKGKGIVFTTSRIPRVHRINLFFLFDFIELNFFKHLFKSFFSSDNPKQESLFIGGFVPMTHCEFALELEKPGEKGFVIIQTPGGKIIIDRKKSGDYWVDSCFRNTAGKFSYRRLVVPAQERKISIKILFDGVARTNTLSANDQGPIVTPFYDSSRSQLDYPTFSGGYIKISTIALLNQGTSTVLLSSLSQSAPRKLITPIGDKKSQAFGLDGPHPLDTIQQGLVYMKKFGFRGTIWFDVLYLKDEEYTAFLKSLVQHESWEAGIHFSRSLAELSQSELAAFISDEYTRISSRVNTLPESWCSLRNGDDVYHANYLHEKFNMIWRNGDAGVRSERKVGGLEDANWEWWNSASQAGVIYPVYTHQTDRDPAPRYSISYPKFKIWIDNYHANGISIIPFHEWWQMNANTNDMRITDISIENQSLRFRVKTNGGRGRVNVMVAADQNPVVMDQTARERINWSDNGDNSITFYVQSNHGYEIFRENP